MVSSNSFDEKISWLFASKPVAMLHIALLIMCSLHDFEFWTTITKCIPFCAFTIFWNIIFIHYSSLNKYLRQFPQSHDEHMTQTVSNMASAISFGIRNHGKYFDEVTYSTKLHSTKWRFNEVTIRRKLSTKCRSRLSVVRRSVVDPLQWPSLNGIHLWLKLCSLYYFSQSGLDIMNNSIKSSNEMKIYRF